ncbi:hypothetical protein FQN54_007955 [Arachnomyces sp. PD_36]|nr:hypothetical protein FQN54_007955 [Arachnomyces sp. PD_36]
MERPSDGWAGFGHLDESSDQHERMQNILSTAKFEFLESQAIIARTRQEDLPSTLTCSINPSRFTWGFNNIVFEVAFSDGIYWIARVQHTLEDSSSNESYATTISEISTINLIRSRTTIPVPQVFDYCISSDNPFGYPYMLTEYLPGRPCNNILARAVPLKYRSKVAKQLANVFFELQNLTFDRIGRIWTRDNADMRNNADLKLISPAIPDGATDLLDTSLEFFHVKREAENREIVQSTHPNDADWLTACWILKIALGHMILDDRIRGPFPLCHLDLHHGNLLFDHEFNLTGVLDWSNAQTAPIERLGVCPEFMTFPALSNEENRPIIEFKHLVIQHLREKEEQSQKADSSLTSLSAFLQSDRAELAYFCTYSHSRRAIWDAKRAAKLMYGGAISWDQLKEVYGTKAVF